MRPLNSTHDPAPSRFRYRMQRWMLTPGVRAGLRLGLPGALAAGLAGWAVTDLDTRAAVTGFVTDLRADIEARPEFRINLMAIDGAGLALAQEIRRIAALDFPVSSFDLDLEALRQAVAALPPVASVSLRIRPGGILQVDVVERQPAVVWRHRDGLTLLDAEGIALGPLAARADRADLPFILGDGADAAVAEAMTLIDAARPLGARKLALVRIGERRWDLVLDRDQRILLPADAPLAALDRVLALDDAQEMLDRDVAVVDMRLGQRPTLRMTPTAVAAWWRIRELNTGTD